MAIHNWRDKKPPVDCTKAQYTQQDLAIGPQTWPDS